MKKILIIFCLIIIFVQENQSQPMTTPMYSVQCILNDMITVDGDQDETVWKSVSPITSFINPWNKSLPQNTSLYMLCDDDSLYFYFNVDDTTLVYEENFTNEMQVTKGDRVELFFSKTIDLSSYIGFEIDPKGRILDYRAKNYRQFDYTWNTNDIRVQALKRKDGYQVEGAISLSLLENYMGQSNTIFWGAFRADFRKTNTEIIENWLCLRDPKTTMPDFHLSRAFSCLKLLKSNK